MTNDAGPTPASGGEMGERIRRFDWENHPLGSPRHWPPTLHTALGICLNSSLPTAIYWGPELWLLYNDAWSAVPRDRHPAALGQRAAELWTDIWDVVGPQFEEVIERGGSVASYDQLLKIERDGRAEETYWNYSLSPIIGPDGSVVGVFNQGHETTDNVLAARSREAETDRLRELFAQAPGAVAILRGPNHVFELANDAYRRLIGRDDDIIGQPVAEALPEVIEQGFIALLNRVYETGEAFRGTAVPVDLVREGQREERKLDFIYQPIREGADVRGIFVEAWDVTETERLFTELKELNTTLELRVQGEVEERLRTEGQLRQAQKMEAVGQLTGGIAHDFNNMLTTILGGLEVARRHLSDPRDPKVDRYLDAAHSSAQRAAALTQRLLAFSRRQSLEIERLDAAALVRGLADLFGSTVGDQATLVLNVDAQAWPVATDVSQLENAVLNLVINARDAMAEGGQLTITVKNVRLEGGRAQDDEEIEPGDYVAISVSDTGSGMSEEVRGRAFEPFFTTKPIGQGTGLGLSMIYGFVRQSNGYASIASIEGEGTTVTLHLPRAEGAAEAAASPAPSVPGPGPLRRARVLVVEDEPLVRMLIVDTLEDLGLEVTEAGDGRRAVEILEADRRFDLLVTDVGLPGLNGRQVAEAARKVQTDLKVLFATGYAEKAAVRGDFLEEGMEMIGKPFDVEDLARRVGQMLDS
ncbi:PAS domain-containing sensor histidine kinase [Parvularcula dongshanensis]|uniref:histidine kinase n=1 Tax=Parvularcula dongshanensis TaxID=1173995 RepID=A0A840I449_9PROT|nr:PAS domain-containing sensor histidine kinase [Parvularcula dongshanensis]MBB4658974.1 signal transduction histidine kinase [Parvularcula dongshanensis]